MADNRLVLVDGSSYLYRAYHALPPLSNREGQPTGALLGVANMLRKLLNEYDPERVAVVFDAPGRTFRDDLFEQYKAQRPPMPDELAQQIEPLVELVAALGLPMLRERGVEADDVIGTLARAAEERGQEVLISTGDKDMAQLVDAHITLVDTMYNKTLDPAGVIAKFGVTAGQIPDYLALVGDTSDNIPGVPGVGPKTAAKWLNEHQTLDALLEHADEIKGKAGERLRECAELLPVYRDLATIRTDLDIDLDERALQRAAIDPAVLRPLLKRLEFTSWLSQIEAPGSTGEGYEIIRTEADLARWLERLGSAKAFAIDTETTSLRYMEAELVGLSFAVHGAAAYLPVAHRDPGDGGQLDKAAVLERLRPLLEDGTPVKIAHNLKYDRSVLARAGVMLGGVCHDTMLESYVLDSTASRHDLDTLANRLLDRSPVKFADVAGKGASQVTFDQVPIDKAGHYAAEDAELTLALHRQLWPELEQQPGLKALYETIEMPLVPVLSTMERNGVLVDAGRLQQQSRELAMQMGEIVEAAHQAAGHAFNLDSPKQVQEVLYGEQGLPARQKTPKGQPSTAESALAELAEEYELPRLILDYRALAKLKSTYTDRLPEMIDPRTGRVHTSYHQAVTATGRLSSSEPNLQNIPIRTPEGRRIRQAFIAPAGRVIMAADYSQIELRIMAHISGDPGLLEAFRRGEDIHAATAAEVFDVQRDAVRDDQRRAAKAINFGLIYGMSDYGLGQQLGIPRGEAREAMDRYFERYPGVRQYMTETREQAREFGYVETLFGRRLYLPEIRSSNAQRQRAAERAAINAPMQGTAADIIKRAMIATQRWLDDSGAAARMVMQVHDELVLEVDEAAVAVSREAVTERMAGAAALEVPLEVEIGIGANWDEAH